MENKIYTNQFECALFNSLANSYDKVNNIANFRLPVFIRKKIIRNLKITSRQPKILDLMSGLGENWEELNVRFPESEITAIDISENMANLSQKTKLKYSGCNIQIINDDIFTAELASNYFDLVICSFGLKCLTKPQIELLAVLLQRILKKDGSFLFIEVSKPHNIIFRISQKIHFQFIVPIVGGLLHNRFKEYQMLWRFLEDFSMEEATSIFKKRGLKINTKTHLFGNIITLKN